MSTTAGSVSGGAKDNTPLIRRSGGINSRSNSTSSLCVDNLISSRMTLAFAGSTSHRARRTAARAIGSFQTHDTLLPPLPNISVHVGLFFFSPDCRLLIPLFLFGRPVLEESDKERQARNKSLKIVYLTNFLSAMGKRSSVKRFCRKICTIPFKYDVLCVTRTYHIIGWKPVSIAVLSLANGSILLVQHNCNVVKFDSDN